MKSPWLTSAGALLLAGLIHVLAVLGMPYVAPRSAWERLSALSNTNEMLILPAAVPEHQGLPLMAPDVRYAVCRYDISAGPVRLSTQLLDDFWMIAFYTPEGQNFYTISGGELKRDKIEFVISTQSEAIFEVGASILDDIDDLVVVAAPSHEGIVVIRAPLSGPSYDARTDEALQHSSCSRKLTGIDRPS